MARLCGAPFDLHAGPWVRFGLLRHASDAGRGSTLVLAMHHIAGDEWSTGVLDRELRVLTSAAADTPSLSSQQLAALPALPQLTVQYTDFAHWQQELLSAVTPTQPTAAPAASARSPCTAPSAAAVRAAPPAAAMRVMGCRRRRW